MREATLNQQVMDTTAAGVQRKRSGPSANQPACGAPGQGGVPRGVVERAMAALGRRTTPRPPRRSAIAAYFAARETADRTAGDASEMFTGRNPKGDARLLYNVLRHHDTP